MDNAELKNNIDEQDIALVTPVITDNVSAGFQQAQNNQKRILVGKVTSNKPDKTIIVSIERQVIHPLYKKYYKVTKTFMAHDPENTCKKGDVVKIIESRPLSSRKRWMLVDVVQRAK
jgi:small subunit ribosomal protein S17